MAETTKVEGEDSQDGGGVARATDSGAIPCDAGEGAGAGFYRGAAE